MVMMGFTITVAVTIETIAFTIDRIRKSTST